VKVIERKATGRLLTRQGEESCMVETLRFATAAVAVAYLERNYGSTHGFIIREEFLDER
jgi:hypothetical protein